MERKKKTEGVLNINGIVFALLDETALVRANIIGDLSGMVGASIKVHDE